MESLHNSRHRVPIIIILICIIAVAAVYSVSVFIRMSRVKDLPPAVDSSVAAKEAMLERVTEAGAKPLTDAEKSSLVNFLSSGGDTYTAEQKNAIISALKSQ